MNFKDFIALQPEIGTAIIFPSELMHSVEVNQSNEDRISIAFNLSVSYEYYGGL